MSGRSPRASVRSLLKPLHRSGDGWLLEDGEDLIDVDLYVAPDGRVLARRKEFDEGADQSPRRSVSMRVSLAGLDQT
jgi:hypothetical protein